MKPRAFTLVELLISVAVFSIVMLLVVGAYLTMIAVDRQTEATATASDNLAFAFEDMMRVIRTGTSYSCGNGLGLGDCSGGGAALTLRDSIGRTVTFTKSAGGAIIETVGGVPSSITDPNVTITNLTFYVSGSSNADTLAPTVRITITGTIPGINHGTLTFHVETGATMRGIDL